MSSAKTGELLKRVQRLQIHCSALVDQQMSGSYGSPFKGQGIEFEETRPYQAGDDVRSIDWRVTAKSGRPFVKRFREERQLSVHLLVDGSASLSAPPIGPTPWDRVAEVAGVLAVVASRDQHRIGMTLFTDVIEHSLPPSPGDEAAMRVLRDIVAWRPVEKQTNLRLPLERLCRVERRRSVAVILSDFLCEGYERALRVAATMHDVIPIVLHHPLQRSLPRCGLLPVRDPETGRSVWIDTWSSHQRRQYQNATASLDRQRDELFARLRVPVLHLGTTDDVAVKLHRFFDRRREER